MFTPQNRLKVIIKPFPVPKSPRSAASSPKASKSTEQSERFPSTSPKQKNTILLKTLDDLSSLFQSAIKQPKNSEKDIKDLIETCEKSVKSTKLKILETPHEGESIKTESKSISDLSSIIKTGNDEYSSFLEHLLTYEQKKSDMILEKSKFPKIRMKEVEKALNEEFPSKPSNSAKALKIKEFSFYDQAKKEIKEMYSKSMRKLKEGAGIPNEIENILEKEESANEGIEIDKSIKENREFINDGNLFIRKSQMFHNELSQIKTDFSKLSIKYNYLIGKFNKQDKTLKHQSKIILNISNNTNELRSIFLNLITEVNEFFSTLIHTLSKKALTRISGVELYEQQKVAWQNEREFFQKENEELREKNQTLKRKVKKLLEDVMDLKVELDNKDNSLRPQSNFNDIIEINKLKDQLRRIAFESNDTVDKYKKENDSLLAQICKVREINNALELKINLLTKVSEKNPDLYEKSSSSSSRNLQSSMETISIGGDSYEKSVKVCDVYELLRDDLDEIVQCVKDHSVLINFQGSSVEFLRKICGFAIKIKENLCEKNCSFEEAIEKLIESHRLKLSPKPENTQELSIRDKQFEACKNKLNAKKSQVCLLKLRINYLKQTVQDLKSELDNTSQLDIDCIKGLLQSVFKELPKLSSATEDLILVLMQNTGFSCYEINQMKLSRKSRQGSFL